MRIKALTVGNVPILNMPNGASEKIKTLPNNSIVILSAIKRDGANSYYFSEENNGYIKKEYLKILRDEEFYYSSSLLKSKINRSNTSFFNLSRQRKEVYPTVKATNNEIKVENNKGGNKTETKSNSSETTIIKSPNSNNETIIEKKPKWSGLDTSTTAASIAVNVMSTINTNNTFANNLLNTGMDMLDSFASTGSWDKANNMDLGGLFAGNKTLSPLMSGATINNLSNGSFFKTTFKENAKKLIGSYINTLMAKLNYVVGFNISGILFDTIDRFGWVNHNSYIGQILYEDVIIKKPVNYHNLNEQIEKYFKYKGCNYKMITRYSDSGQKWEQEAYFNTPTMSSSKSKEEVKIYQSIYNTFYDEFEDAINKAKESLNLNISKDDWFINFNRYRLIHPDSVLTRSRGYVFFTRPDLNITMDNITSDAGSIFFNICGRYPDVVKSLTKSLSGSHQFIPLLSNRCTGMDVQNEQLETKELGETITGWKLTYGMNIIKSRSAGSVSTSFVDDQSLSIYALFKIWCEYISSISRGIISPRKQYIRTKQLDYACSIYYFLCSEDGENIIFWTKYTGCIPTSVPSSNFADSIDNMISVPKYTIDWQYAFKRDLDPMTLAEFNKLTGSGFEYENIYNQNSIRSAKTIVGAPFIETTDGGKTFKLRFRKKYR